MSETIANDAYAVHALRLFGREAKSHARDFIEAIRALFLKEAEPLEIEEEAGNGCSRAQAGCHFIPQWLDGTEFR